MPWTAEVWAGARRVPADRRHRQATDLEAVVVPNGTLLATTMVGPGCSRWWDPAAEQWLVHVRQQLRRQRGRDLTAYAAAAAR